MTYAATVQALTGLVGYYRLGEPSGTTATDSSGHGNDGTYVNGPTLGVASLLASTSDTAMSTTSVSNKYVNLPSAIKDALNGSSWSVGVWVKLAGNTTHGLLIGPKAGASARIFGTRYGAGTTVSFAEENVSLVGGADVGALSTGTTYLIVYTYGGGVLKAYLNNALIHGPSYSFTTSFTGTVTISSPTSSSDGSENATYDEVFFTTSTIALSDVQALYTAGTTVPPVAAFSADVTSGTAPLTVQFTDASTNTPTSWAWDFGDSSTSTSQSPSHQYAAAGVYTVTLTATNAGGSDPEVKTGYITVTAPAATGSRVRDFLLLGYPR